MQFDHFWRFWWYIFVGVDAYGMNYEMGVWWFRNNHGRYIVEDSIFDKVESLVMN